MLYNETVSMKLALILLGITTLLGASYIYFINKPGMENETVTTISNDLSGLSTSSNVMNPNKPVTPPKNIPPNTPKPIVNSQCYTGGCSGQLCTEKPDIMSTCEWKEEYACYQGATCERQASGGCGWTETPKLTQCLKNASSYQAI